MPVCHGAILATRMDNEMSLFLALFDTMGA